MYAYIHIDLHREERVSMVILSEATSQNSSDKSVPVLF